MKKQISLLFAVFLCCSTISWAQNPEESKMKDEFYKTLNSLRQEKKQALRLCKSRTVQLGYHRQLQETSGSSTKRYRIKLWILLL